MAYDLLIKNDKEAGSRRAGPRGMNAPLHDFLLKVGYGDGSKRSR